MIGISVSFFIIYTAVDNALSESSEEEQIHIAQNALRLIELEMNKKIEKMKWYTSETTIQEHLSNSDYYKIGDNQHYIFQSKKKNNWNMHLIDRDGIIQFSSQKERIGSRILDTNDSIRSQINSDKTVITDIVGRNTPFIYLSTPIFDRTTTQHVGNLVSETPWATMRKQIEPLIEETFSIYNNKGQLVATNTDQSQFSIDPHYTDIKAYIENKKDASFTSDISQKNRYFYAVVFPDANSFIHNFQWYLKVRSPVEKIYSVAKQKAFEMSLLILISTIFLVPITLIAAHRVIIYPIKQLTNKVTTTPADKLLFTIDGKPKDEIEELSLSFNHFSTELKKLNTHLEKKVKDRTKALEKKEKELNKKINELERFQKIAINRETRMVELKKKIGTQNKSVS